MNWIKVVHAVDEETKEIYVCINNIFAIAYVSSEEQEKLGPAVNGKIVSNAQASVYTAEHPAEIYKAIQEVQNRSLLESTQINAGIQQMNIDRIMDRLKGNY
jgi:ribosomal protein L10